MLKTVVVTGLNDCDNFLKDSLVNYDYPEFAESLWIPALRSTLTRVSLLCEAVNWGKILGLVPAVIDKFIEEVSLDVKKQMKRFVDASVKRGKENRDYIFNQMEFDACRMQGMLPFFDTSLYPKGMPKRTFNPNEFKNKKNTTGVHHVQYFLEHSVTLAYTMNCFMGPLATATSDTIEMEYFLEKGKSYEVRVLYWVTIVDFVEGDGSFGLIEFDFGFEKANKTSAEHKQRMVLSSDAGQAFCHHESDLASVFGNSKKKIPRKDRTDDKLKCKDPGYASINPPPREFAIQRVFVGVHSGPSQAYTLKAECQAGCEVYGLEVIQLGHLTTKLKR